jgi:hypothetical protein
VSGREIHRQLLRKLSAGSSAKRIPQAVGSAVKKPFTRRSAGRTRADGGLPSPDEDKNVVDLKRRRDLLNARVAELQWDLGGLVYEMATRDAIRLDVIVRRAAELQTVDSELSEVERILRLEEHSTAGECASCGAPHSTGAAYCWQCGQPLLPQVSSDPIATAPSMFGES